MSRNKKDLNKYIKDSIIESLVEDYKMDKDEAKRILEESWLNNKIDKYPQLFNHDHPTKWAKEVYEHSKCRMEILLY